jgi:hypothetical protein
MKLGNSSTRAKTMPDAGFLARFDAMHAEALAMLRRAEAPRLWIDEMGRAVTA